jgi:hypothetical protein
MWSDAHIYEGIRISVGADDVSGANLAGVKIISARTGHPLNDLAFVGLIREQLKSLRRRHF